MADQSVCLKETKSSDIVSMSSHAAVALMPSGAECQGVEDDKDKHCNIERFDCSTWIHTHHDDERITSS